MVHQAASWVLGSFKDRTKHVMLQLYKPMIRSAPYHNQGQAGSWQIVKYSLNIHFALLLTLCWKKVSFISMTAIQQSRIDGSILRIVTCQTIMLVLLITFHIYLTQLSNTVTV